MGVHDDHRRRVYERFLREGLAGFEEHNAMEFLLFLARPRGDTNPLAHALIDRFGSLSAVLDAPIEELERVPGVGHSSAVVLKFIPQMCAYYLENKTSHKVPLTSVEEASAFFMPKFFARTQEAFYMALWMTAACCCAACSSPRAAPTPRRFPWRKWSPKHSNAGRRA